MAQKIESDKLFIKDVFSKWYRIPEYQRPYVWGVDQVTELLDDVFQARNNNPDAQYFLGSMVLKKNIKRDGETEFEEYDLLDGQQRVTTLFLLTAVIRDLSPATNDNLRRTCSESLFQMANPYDSIPERIRIVFDIRDKVKAFVDEFVKPVEATTNEGVLTDIANRKDEDISIKNMAQAILTIREYFNNGRSIDDFFTFLRKNVLMIYVAAEELEDAFHLFTVMNNRGIKLRNSDILKAENLKEVCEADRVKEAKKWEEIEEYFGEDFDNFLSHLRTILVKQKASYNLLKEFHENIYNPREYDRNTKTYYPKPSLLKKGADTFRFITKYHNYYQQLFESDQYSLTNSFEFYNHIKLMQKGFEADLWVPVLLRYYDKFKTINLVEFTKALEHKFAADWLIGLTPTDRIDNINKLIQRIDDSITPEEILQSVELSIQAKELSSIFDGNVYGRRAARYILLKVDLLYHGYTSRFNPPATISIEHILPQNPNPGSQWVIDFSADEREKWTNRIGNLVLISRRKNTSQSNRDYADKKERYFKNNVELFSNSVRIYQRYTTWKPGDLQANHNEVTRKLFTAFNIPILQQAATTTSV